MSFTSYVFQDKTANYGNPTKGRYVVVLFRIAQYLRRRKLLFYLFCWYFLFYRFFVEWCWGVELSWHTEVGSGFQIYHGTGLVIHPNTIIGKNVSLRQCTTLGVKLSESHLRKNAPVIGDNVDIGCNVSIIGAIIIGASTTIGAGSVVVKDIPPFSVAVGNPAQVLRSRNENIS